MCSRNSYLIKWNVCGLCVENRYPMRRLHLVRLRRHNVVTVKLAVHYIIEANA